VAVAFVLWHGLVGFKEVSKVHFYGLFFPKILCGKVVRWTRRSSLLGVCVGNWASVDMTQHIYHEST
jgi:hypothetical protein